MPDKRRLATSKVCFGSERPGLLENSYDKCALVTLFIKNDLFCRAKIYGGHCSCPKRNSGVQRLQKNLCCSCWRGIRLKNAQN